MEQAKINYLKEQLAKSQKSVTAKKTEFESLNKQLIDKQEERSGNIDKLNNLQSKLDGLEKVYVDVVEQVKLSEQAVNGNTEEMQDAVNKLSEIKSNVAKLQTELEAIKERMNELSQKQGVMQTKFDEAEREMEDAKSSRVEAENNKKAVWDELTTLRESLAKTREEESELKVNLQNNVATLSKLETRVKLLSEMQADYEGYNNTVRRLLLDAGKNAELKRLLVGVVGELITVPKDYETAIEMALGYAVQNIVTNSEQDAKKLVSYLKQHNYGRATFLPINSMKPKYISSGYQDLLHIPGCFGVASELIEYDKRLDSVFKGLLGSTVLVRDMDVAVKLANDSKFGFKIVTLEGDIINPAGSISGGSKKAEVNNLLSRDREIETLTEQVSVLRGTVEEKKSALTRLTENLAGLIKNVDSKTQQLHDSEILFTQKDELFKHAQEDCDLYAAELGEITEELSKLSTKQTSLISSLEAYNSQETANVKIGASGESNGSSNMIESLREQREELSTQITQIKVDVATLNAQNKSINAEIERILAEQEELSLSMDEDNAVILSNSQAISQAEEKNNVDEEVDVDSEKKKLELYQSKVNEMEELKQQLHAGLAGIEEERTRVGNELSMIQERLYHEEAKLTQIDTTLENMESRILDDYDLTYLTAQTFKDVNFKPEGVNGRINELKREINKLGNVNVNAIEDSKELDTRYTDLTTQLTDLKQAESDIMTVINELSTQMTEKFDTQFTKINENFSRTFRELFGGGKARLVLTSDDVLTAGVEIIAEPPGKALGNLSLLSGGEKSLTAIAILFAILKLRPMPFCLLDEIDAALDDANVERFAKYLHNFAGETQFIVITHRKPTMELADNLYGVTMENKGVSKVVSVKLSDALQNAVVN